MVLKPMYRFMAYKSTTCDPQTIFSCFGAHQNGKSTNEIKIRVAMAKAAIWKLEKMKSSQAMLSKTKFQLVRSIIMSMLLHGCEAWAYSEEIRKKGVGLYAM